MSLKAVVGILWCFGPGPPRIPVFPNIPTKVCFLVKRSFVAQTAIRQSRTTVQHGTPVIRQKPSDDGKEPKLLVAEKRRYWRKMHKADVACCASHEAYRLWRHAIFM